MFALFFSLYNAMFTGIWDNLGFSDIRNFIEPSLNKIGEVITSLFNGTTSPVTDLGDVLFVNVGPFPTWVALVSFVLALITSIGIVVMAVKGVKKAFGIFFMGIRNI